MNDENNNLNGVVLGSVPTPNNQNVNQVNPGNIVIPPEPVTNPVNNSQVKSVINTGVNSVNNQVMMPNNNVVQNNQSQTVEPNIQNVQPVTNNIQTPSGQVVTPTQNNVVNPQPSLVQPNPVQSNPIQSNPVVGQNLVNNVNNNGAQANEQSAFTSINAIEQNKQNQNFDTSIGTNPPISLEKDKTPKKKNKTLFIVVVILLLLGVALGTYYILNYTDLLSKKETITINTNDLTISSGDALSNNINDYASITGTNSSNCSLDIKDVDNTKVGIYKYTVTCSNKTKEGKIVVVDDKPLIVETKTVYIASGETIEAKDFIKKIDNNITYDFVNKEEIDSILNGDLGTYSVKIKASSVSGKETEVEAKLVKIQYKIKGYLVCRSSDQNINNAIMTTFDRFAIVDDGNNGFGNIIYENNIIKFNNENDYSQIVSDYNTNGSININDITGDVELDESNLTISVSNEIDSNVLKEKYGEDKFATYSTIRAYYVNTLGYECSYEKAND